MKLIYLKSELKFNSFGVTIGIKFAFCRVSVAVEPGHSLLQHVISNCLKPVTLSKNLTDFCRLTQKKTDILFLLDPTRLSFFSSPFNFNLFILNIIYQEKNIVSAHVLV